MRMINSHFNNLTDEQKAHFKPLIDNAQTRGEVDKQIALAKQLNDDMGTVKGQISYKDKVHQSSDYINADPAKKKLSIMLSKKQKIYFIIILNIRS